jgi:hypothetical protein
MNVLIVNLIISLSINIQSDNGLFRGSVQYWGGAELTTQSFTLYDRYDAIMYTKEDISVYTFFINNTGGVFALNEHRLYFYQRDGSEMLLRELVYPNGFGFSPDNSFFFASDREGIFVYSHEGVLVRTYRPGRLFTSTGNGESVAVISADTLFLYHSGRLIDTELLSAAYARDVYFSADAESLVVEFRDDIGVYDTRTRAWVKQK